MFDWVLNAPVQVPLLPVSDFLLKFALKRQDNPLVTPNYT